MKRTEACHSRCKECNLPVCTGDGIYHPVGEPLFRCGLCVSFCHYRWRTDLMIKLLPSCPQYHRAHKGQNKDHSWGNRKFETILWASSSAAVTAMVSIYPLNIYVDYALSSSSCRKVNTLGTRQCTMCNHSLGGNHGWGCHGWGC